MYYWFLSTRQEEEKEKLFLIFVLDGMSVEVRWCNTTATLACY